MKVESLLMDDFVVFLLLQWMGLEYDSVTWELKGDLISKGFEAPIKQFLSRDQDWIKALEGEYMYMTEMYL